MENNTKKIVVKREYELTDVISDILNTKEENLILTFAEESDILISPINLKVILETADENEKLLLLQIINNPSGVRNSKLAGMHVIETANTPGEGIWETISKEKEERLKPPKKESKKEEKKIEQPKEEKSSFEKRINEAINKSKEIKPTPKPVKEKTEDDFISIGGDLPIEETDLEPKPFPTKEETPKKDLSKMDFKETPQRSSLPHPQKERKDFSLNKMLGSIKLPKLNIPQKGPKDRKPNSPAVNQIKRLAPIVGIGIVLVGGLSLFAYYRVASFVKVKIFVEAKEVAIEETFTGDENLKEIDFENKKIPVKVETVEKSRSTTTNATGTAYRGEKAKGSVNLTYIKTSECTEDDNVSLPAGQSITSSGGYKYTLDSGVTVACNNMIEASVSAIEVGEEYNISSGQFFTVQGYSSSELYGLNSSGAFTGGSKEEYTVLSQADVDSAVEDLKETAIEEGENDLRDISGSWEIIESSIESEVVEDSIDTDTPVGSEASNVNVSMKIESSATYYFKEGFEDSITKLLTAEAEKKNLFENDSDFDLILGEDIEQDISVEDTEGDTVKIKLSLSGSVKPDVDKEEIVEALGGKKWEEGVSTLSNYKYSEQPIEISFNPDSIPERFWYFPGKQGGILITIEDIQE